MVKVLARVRQVRSPNLGQPNLKQCWPACHHFSIYEVR